MLFQGCRHWVEPLRYLGRKRNPPLPAVSQMPPKEPQAPRTRIKTLLCRTCRAGRATRSSQIQAHKRRGVRIVGKRRHKHTAEGRSSEWLARARKKLFAFSTRGITTISGSCFMIPKATVEDGRTH